MLGGLLLLWRDVDGFEGMMERVLEQAAEKGTKVDVEVHCFRRQ